MPRTFKTRAVDPRDPSGIQVHGNIGDICVTDDGRRFVKWGSGACDWKPESDPSGGGPFRTAQAPQTSSKLDSDPHRAWIMANFDWPYTEMDWSDEDGYPARIQWKIDDVIAEVHTDASKDRTRVNRLSVHKPRLGGVKDITIGDREAGGTWVPDDNGQWSTEFAVNMKGVKRTSDWNAAPDRAIPATAIRDRAIPAVRGFVEAYAEIERLRREES